MPKANKGGLFGTKFRAFRSDAYRVALSKRAEQGAIDQKNVIDHLKQQKGSNQLSGETSRWAQKEDLKSDAISSLAPLNVDRITFDSFVFEGTPAEKDKFKRQTEKNQDIASQMAKSMEKIAENTKAKLKQDTKIKKDTGGPGGVAGSMEKIAEKTFKEKANDFAGGIWDKIIDGMTRAAGFLMLGAGLSFLTKLALAPAKWLLKFALAPAKIVYEILKPMGVVLYKAGKLVLGTGAKLAWNGTKWVVGAAVKTAFHGVKAVTDFWKVAKLAGVKNVLKGLTKIGGRGFWKGIKSMGAAGLKGIGTTLKGFAKLPVGKLWSKGGWFMRAGMLGAAAAGVYFVAKALGVEDSDWIKAKDTIVDWFITGTFAKVMKNWWDSWNIQDVWKNVVSRVVNWWEVTRKDGVWAGLKLAGNGAIQLYKDFYGKSYELFSEIMNDKNPGSKLISIVWEGILNSASKLSEWVGKTQHHIWAFIQRKIVDKSPKIAKMLGIIDEKVVSKADKSNQFVTPYGKKVTKAVAGKLIKMSAEYADLEYKIKKGKNVKASRKRIVEIDNYFLVHYGVSAWMVTGYSRKAKHHNDWLLFTAQISSGHSKTHISEKDMYYAAIDNQLQLANKAEETKYKKATIKNAKNNSYNIANKTGKKIGEKIVGAIPKTIAYVEAAASDVAGGYKRNPGTPSTSKGTGIMNFDGGKGPARSVRANGKRAILYHNGKIKVGGHRSWRNNNPGNVYCDKRKKNIKKFGAVGCDGSSNDGVDTSWSGLIFATMEDGFKAQKQVLSNTYGTRTIAYMATKYQKGNAVAYTNGICRRAGLSPHRVINSLSEKEFSALVIAQAKQEGMKAGTILNGVEGNEITADVGNGWEQLGANAGNMVGSASNSISAAGLSLAASVMPGLKKLLASASAFGASAAGKVGDWSSMSSNIATQVGKDYGGTGSAGIARGMVGKIGYTWGGKDGGVGLDCSGFIQKVMRQAGVKDFPGNTTIQLKYLLKAVKDGRATRIIHVSQLQGGDIIMFAGHIAIMGSKTTMIHSSGGSKCTGPGRAGAQGCRGVVEVASGPYLAHRPPIGMFRMNNVSAGDTTAGSLSPAAGAASMNLSNSSINLPSGTIYMPGMGAVETNSPQMQMLKNSTDGLQSQIGTLNKKVNAQAQKNVEEQQGDLHGSLSVNACHI